MWHMFTCSASPPNHQGRCPGSSQWGQCWFKKIVCITPDVSAAIAAPFTFLWVSKRTGRSFMTKKATCGTGSLCRNGRWLECCKCTVVCLLRTLSSPAPWCWLLKLSRSCREDLINQTITTSWRSNTHNLRCLSFLCSRRFRGSFLRACCLIWILNFDLIQFNSAQSFLHSFLLSFLYHHRLHCRRRRHCHRRHRHRRRRRCFHWCHREVDWPKHTTDIQETQVDPPNQDNDWVPSLFAWDFFRLRILLRFQRVFASLFQGCTSARIQGLDGNSLGFQSELCLGRSMGLIIPWHPVIL